MVHCQTSFDTCVRCDMYRQSECGRLSVVDGYRSTPARATARALVRRCAWTIAVAIPRARGSGSSTMCGCPAASTNGCCAQCARAAARARDSHARVTSYARWSSAAAAYRRPRRADLFGALLRAMVATSGAPVASLVPSTEDEMPARLRRREAVGARHAMARTDRDARKVRPSSAGARRGSAAPCRPTFRAALDASVELERRVLSHFRLLSTVDAHDVAAEAERFGRCLARRAAVRGAADCRRACRREVARYAAAEQSRATD